MNGFQDKTRTNAEMLQIQIQFRNAYGKCGKNHKGTNKNQTIKKEKNNSNNNSKKCVEKLR